jgi:hypothetical protein
VVYQMRKLQYDKIFFFRFIRCKIKEHEVTCVLMLKVQGLDVEGAKEVGAVLDPGNLPEQNKNKFFSTSLLAQGLQYEVKRDCPCSYSLYCVDTLTREWSTRTRSGTTSHS